MSELFQKILSSSSWCYNQNYFCHAVVYAFKIPLARNVFSCPTILLFSYRCYQNPAKQKASKADLTRWNIYRNMLLFMGNKMACRKSGSGSYQQTKKSIQKVTRRSLYKDKDYVRTITFVVIQSMEINRSLCVLYHNDFEFRVFFYFNRCTLFPTQTKEEPPI